MFKNRSVARRITALLAAGAVALAGCSSADTGADDETVTVTSSVQATASGSGDDTGSAPSPSSADSAGDSAAAPSTAAENSGSAAGSSAAGSSEPGSSEPAPSSEAGSSEPGTSSAPASSKKSSTAKPTTSGSKADSKPKPDTSKDTVEWDDNTMVSHLFFHSLIVDPERAFSDAESGAGYLDYMVTQEEFTKVLQQVYDNGYVLVSPHQLASVEDDGSVHLQPLKLPKGKKPLVLSIDDVSYYEYMEGDGFATDLFVADNGRVLNHYTDAAGKTHEGSYDVMPMVDDFVREHPDFSHDGARGVIALTGYNGVFGYRSSPSEYAGKNPNLDKDIATAKGVAKALKDEGWEFASHSWGHINFTNSSVGQIQADNEKWKADVEPIVGPTDMLIYPFGADISGVPGYSGAKFDYLKGQGFSYFFNVDGSTPAWGQWDEQYLREARINVDGISLKAAIDGRKVLSEFFDPKSVLDPARPASISGTG